MAYFQDGTQKFGIPDSPVTINSVPYIAENITLNAAAKVVEINNADGSPAGQAIITGNPTGSAKLQFATNGTAKPSTGMTFTLQGAVYYVTSVGETQSQGAYASCDIGITKQIAP